MVRRLLCFILSSIFCFPTFGNANKITPTSVFYTIYSDSSNFSSLIKKLQFSEKIEKETLLWLENEKLLYKPLPQVTYDPNSDIIKFGPPKGGFEFDLITQTPLIFRINNRILQYEGTLEVKSIFEFLHGVFAKDKKVSVLKYFLPDAEAQIFGSASPSMTPILIGMGCMVLATGIPAWYASRASETIAKNNKEVRDYKKMLREDEKKRIQKSDHAKVSDVLNLQEAEKEAKKQEAQLAANAASASNPQNVMQFDSSPACTNPNKDLLQKAYHNAEAAHLIVSNCDSTTQKFASQRGNEYYAFQFSNTEEIPNPIIFTVDTKNSIEKCYYNITSSENNSLLKFSKTSKSSNSCESLNKNKNYLSFKNSSKIDIETIRSCCRDTCCSEMLSAKYKFEPNANNEINHETQNPSQPALEKKSVK